METKNEFTLFENINSVGKSLKDSKLSEEIITQLTPQLKSIAEELHSSEREALFFTLIFYNNINNEFEGVDLMCIASFLKIDLMSILGYNLEIEQLYHRQLIEKERNMSMSNILILNYNLNVSAYVLDLILNNSKIPDEIRKNEDDQFEFVRRIFLLLNYRGPKKLEIRILCDYLNEEEERSNHLNLVQRIKKLGLDEIDRVIFYSVCDEFLDGDSVNLNDILVDIYSNVYMRMEKATEILEGKNRLLVLGLIELEGGGFMSDSNLTLADKGKELFLEENVKLFLTKKKTEKMIHPDNINHKALYYDSELDEQINFIRKSFQDSTFICLQERLVAKSMPKGIAAIFYGAPGTGKTETVYQLAKATGRAIVHVDISQSKSMWFGESEKRIKDIFVTYKKLCTSEPLTPILLFNEADAIFGKRKIDGVSNVIQTENAIQNIILEEMEKLEGILIATTNLNKNLDAAFERRFLFKVEFKMPSPEVKQKIWQDKISWLNEKEARMLATNYSFSGGEIDNVVRKITMDEVLNGVTGDFTQIERYCMQEGFDQAKKQRVGFVNS